MNIKDLIKNNTVHIDRYRHQHIYYRISYLGEDYTFPVPLEDVQDATLHSEEKAITMMRYIRKAIDEGTLIKA
jgi:hypothetical protein